MSCMCFFVSVTLRMFFPIAGEKSERPLWFPGGYAPAYLKGEFPGDRGFDPAGLAADPKQFAFYRLAEVFHGRLAMLAIVGAVTQEYLGKGAWYEGPRMCFLCFAPPKFWILTSINSDIFQHRFGNWQFLSKSDDFFLVSNIFFGRMVWQDLSPGVLCLLRTPDPQRKHVCCKRRCRSFPARKYVWDGHILEWRIKKPVQLFKMSSGLEVVHVL